MAGWQTSFHTIYANRALKFSIDFVFCFLVGTDNRRDELINIAVAGDKRSGKSSLINAVRNLKPGDPHATAVGLGSTSETARYCFGDNVFLWEIRTMDHTTVDFGRFDGVVICCNTKSIMTDCDMGLVEACARDNIPCVIAGSMIDDAIAADIYDLYINYIVRQRELIRKSIVEQLRIKRIGFEVYLISSVEPLKWDMEKVVSFIKGLGKRPAARQNVTKNNKSGLASKQKIMPARQVHSEEHTHDKMQGSTALEQGSVCISDPKLRGSCKSDEHLESAYKLPLHRLRDKVRSQVAHDAIMLTTRQYSGIKPGPTVKLKHPDPLHSAEFTNDNIQDSSQLEQGSACISDQKLRGSCISDEHSPSHTRDNIMHYNTKVSEYVELETDKKRDLKKQRDTLRSQVPGNAMMLATRTKDRNVWDVIHSYKYIFDQPDINLDFITNRLTSITQRDGMVKTTGNRVAYMNPISNKRHPTPYNEKETAEMYADLLRQAIKTCYEAAVNGLQ